MVPAYARVLLGKKPYSAPEGTKIEPVELEARKVVLSAAHIRRYRDVCAVPASATGQMTPSRSPASRSRR